MQLQPPSTHGCHSHPQAQRGGVGGGTCHKSTPSSHSPAPGSQPSQTQVLSKGLISSSAVCHPPRPQKIFPFCFPLCRRDRARESHLRRQRECHKLARDFLSWGRGVMQRGQESIVCCVRWGIGQGVMGFKLQGARLMPDIRKRFLTEQTVNYSSRLPGEAPESPSLEVFRNSLGGHPLGGI